MEKAIILNNLNSLDQSKLKGFDRVYYGNEFCPNLIPDTGEIKKNLEALRNIKKPISFLTSYIDSSTLEKTKASIAYLVKQKIIDEIVVNDLGLYSFCLNEYPDIKLVVGRFLSQIIHMGAYEKLKISRIETDRNLNCESIIARQKKLSEKIGISFYYPFTVVQGTRYCSMVESSNGRLNPGIQKCKKECLKIGSLKAGNSFLKNDIILSGNVQLLRVTSMSDIRRMDGIYGIDRIVYQKL